jgi:hypothetical protein
MLGNFLTIQENAATLTSVFNVVTIIEQDCYGAAGDTSVGQLELVSGSAAASDEERRLSDGNRSTRRIGSNNFQDCFADGQVVRHECFRSRILARTGDAQYAAPGPRASPTCCGA